MKKRVLFYDKYIIFILKFKKFKIKITFGDKNH